MQQFSVFVTIKLMRGFAGYEYKILDPKIYILKYYTSHCNTLILLNQIIVSAYEFVRVCVCV